LRDIEFLCAQGHETVNQEQPQQHKLVLASTSPRRAEILVAVGWPFDAISPGVDETRLPGEPAEIYVKRLAQSKAGAVAAQTTSGLVLGADTVVVVDGEILGQPGVPQKAREMLLQLRGRWHEVITGVAIVQAGSERGLVDLEVTRVRFAEMSDSEIDWYSSTPEPLDKAGAYAIQGLAALFIEEVQGDYFNIVGLPIRLVYELVQRMTATPSNRMASGS
jgi:septum formation protein